jgi:hypothetical protein
MVCWAEWEGVDFGFDFLQGFGRKAVSKAESDVLDCDRAFKMGNVSAGVPEAVLGVRVP